MERPPAIDRAGHRNADRSVRGDHAVPGAGAHRLKTEPARRAAGAGKPLHFLRLRVPHQDVDVATNPAGGRLKKAETRVHRDRCVRRQSAATKDVQTGKRRQRMRAARRTVQPVNRRAGGEGRSDWPVASADMAGLDPIFSRNRLWRQSRLGLRLGLGGSLGSGCSRGHAGDEGAAIHGPSFRHSRERGNPPSCRADRKKKAGFPLSRE